MEKTNSRIIVGKFGSSYGVHGWLRVFSFTEKIENIFSYQPWYVKSAGEWQLIELKGYKSHNRSMIVKIAGIDDRDKANSLANDEIYVDTNVLPQLTGDDFYWKDLIGCRVITINGCDLGLVTDLMETGSNDVLIIKASLDDAFGAKDRLLPLVDHEVIKHIDLNTKLIKVDWDPAF